MEIKQKIKKNKYFNQISINKIKKENKCLHNNIVDDDINEISKINNFNNNDKNKLKKNLLSNNK